MPVREQALMHRAYKAVDCFCGAGGAAQGYWIAGFDIVGIDQDPAYHRRYPFTFVQFDAIAYLATLLNDSTPIENNELLPPELRFVPQFIHASPPCQIYSPINSFPSVSNRVDLVDITRDHLLALQEKYPDLCWIIENVAGAPLIDPVELCGATFGLKTYRHRYFEISHREIAELIMDHAPPHIPHIRPQAGLGRRPLPHEFMQVVGGLADVAAARIAMGIPWMSGPELAQAIPPSYTAFLGSYMRKHLDQLNKGKPLFGPVATTT